MVNAPPLRVAAFMCGNQVSANEPPKERGGGGIVPHMLANVMHRKVEATRTQNGTGLSTWTGVAEYNYLTSFDERPALSLTSG